MANQGIKLLVSAMAINVASEFLAGGIGSAYDAVAASFDCGAISRTTAIGEKALANEAFDRAQAYVQEALDAAPDGACANRFATHYFAQRMRWENRRGRIAQAIGMVSQCRLHAVKVQMATGDAIEGRTLIESCAIEPARTPAPRAPRRTGWQRPNAQPTTPERGSDVPGTGEGAAAAKSTAKVSREPGSAVRGGEGIGGLAAPAN